MTSPFFSIIIPVYKVEKYLHQCVDSVLAQSYTNYEVILVDDGSPDSCPQICDEYAAKDSRIRTVHRVNGGLSSARNAGLSSCSADKVAHYVIFMDSDDFWIDNDGLQKLSTVVKRYPQCDYYGFNCAYYYQNDDKYTDWIRFDEHITTPIDSNTAIHYLVQSGTFPMSAWSKVLSYDFLIRNNIQFKVGIVGEDIPWFINILDHAELCVYTNLYLYGYRQQVQTSITRSSGSKGFYDLFQIIETEIDNMEYRKFVDYAKDDLYSFIAYEFSILLALLVKLPRAERKSFRKKMYKYKWLLRYTSNPKVKKVSILSKLFGLRTVECMLTIYQKVR